MTDVDWNFQLAEQLDWHWREQLRPRLDGMTDAEYRWEPVPGAWNVRPRGTGTAPVQVGAGEFTIDFACPGAGSGAGDHHRLAARAHHRRGAWHAGGRPLRRADVRLGHAPLSR